MNKFKAKIKSVNKKALIAVVFAVLALVLFYGINKVRAEWEEPSSVAPAGNIYVPLNVGPNNQAKQGALILDPNYDPNGVVTSSGYPLEVRNASKVYVSLLDVVSQLTVDTDTLYVQAGQSQDERRVGMGTTTPGTKLEVTGGLVSVGSQARPVGGSAIAATTTGASNYGVYGESSAAAVPAVYGQSVDGIGLYGVNVSSGTGLHAESGDGSAVVGVSSAVMDFYNPVAGIYGQAGPLGWAGYFKERLYGTDSLIGRKFVPNRLQTSEFPYTAGWEVKQIEDSYRVAPSLVVYDGHYVWAIDGAEWGNVQAYLLDPVSGGLVSQFSVEDAGLNVAHTPMSAIYAGGYIWLANSYDDAEGVTRIDPQTHVAVHFQTGSHANFNDGAVDLAYDDVTAGGPYIWTVNRIAADNSYSITRLKPSDNTYQVFTYSGFDCSSWNGSGISSLELGWPSGIAFDGSNKLWVSFRGVIDATHYVGAGMAEIDTSDPGNSASFVKHCIGDTRFPTDIDVGGGFVWISQEAPSFSPSTHNGFTRYQISDSATQEFTFTYGANNIKYDGVSSGGPYVWLSNYYSLLKYDGNGNLVNYYTEPDGGGGFDFDRTSSTVPYVWASHSTSGFISRNMIDNPYTINKFLVKGALSSAMAYDGTYLWLADDGSDMVSQYRASDGTKVGEVRVGWYPRTMAFDGKYLWVTYENRPPDMTELARVDVATGQVVNFGYISNTDYAGAENFEQGADMAFDGRYLWVSDNVNNKLRKIDTIACNAGACTASFYDLTGQPYYLAFDGQYLWATHNSSLGGNNAFSKINIGNGAVISTYRLPTDSVNDQANNIKSITFDGTYLWLGTKYMDSLGNSIFKVRASDGALVSKTKIYTEPGLCAGGTSSKYCTSNADCVGNGTCSVTEANVRSLIFDGTQIWALQEKSNSGGRECSDWRDNNGDGFCDYNGCCSDGSTKNQSDCTAASLPWYLPDPSCESTGDLHEDLGNECSDGLDNDGNGLCDFDGAAGHPGCSGRPDPGCSSVTDQGESTQTQETHISRILAAAGQFLESIPYARYCTGPADLTFDGSSIWFNEAGSNCGGKFVLRQFYSGSGLGLTNFSSSVKLNSVLSYFAQPGDFSISGSATVGARLTVVGDLAVSGNTWGGASDTAKSLGTACDNGQYAKGVDLNAGNLLCRPL